MVIAVRDFCEWAVGIASFRAERSSAPQVLLAAARQYARSSAPRLSLRLPAARSAAGIAALLVAAAPAALKAAEQSAGADEDKAEAACLMPIGSASNTPPTLRLAVMTRFGTSDDPKADFMAAALTSAAQFLPVASSDPAATLNAEGVADVMAGRHAAAQQRLDECLQTATRRADVQAEATCANNLGVLLGARGQYPQAQAMLERASRRFHEWRQGLPAPRPGLADREARTPAEAGQAMRQAMGELRNTFNRRDAALGFERAELNLGNLAVAVGQLAEAERRFKRALDSHSAVALPACKAAAANDLARLYRHPRLGRQAEAAALVGRYGNGGDVVKRNESIYFPDMGTVALSALAQSPSEPNRAQPAAATAEQPLADRLGSRDSAALRQLLEQAAREERAAQPQRAAASYGSAALRAAAAQRPEIEVSAHAALMRLYTASAQPAVATYHGKLAANLMQNLRGGLTEAGLPRAARRTYLRDRAQVYTALAQGLIDQARLDEAELVIRMLKEDEGQQFQPGAAKPAVLTLPELPQEKAARQQFDQAAQALRQIDDDRKAVAADKANALLLTRSLAEIEQGRLDAGIGLAEFLDSAKKGGITPLETWLRRNSVEYQRAFAVVFGNQAQRLHVGLRHLAEDAPQFRATVATPQQLVRIDESLRRVKEVQAAVEPLLERLRREPGQAMTQWMQTDMQDNPLATLAARPAEVRDMSMALTQSGGASMGQLQRAQGIAMAELTAAATGTPATGQLASIDAELRGQPPEQLDAFAKFVREQGQSLAAAQSQTPDLVANSDSLRSAIAAVSVVNGLTKTSRTDPQALIDATRAAARRPPDPQIAANALANAQRVKDVQAELERAVARARPSVGAPLAAQLDRAMAATPTGQATLHRQEQEEREARQAAAMFLEPTERLWRGNQARERIEVQQRQAEAALAAKLAVNVGSAPSSDETLSQLAGQSPPTALLYYLADGDRLDILLVTAKGRQVWRKAVARAELDARIGQLQAALRDPRSDPRLPARKMYDTLIEPAASALAASGTQVVAVSLTGKLRFVPFAALHDGEQWLAERYTLAVHTGARLGDALRAPTQQWRVAAFGAAAGGAGLPPLPSVRAELDQVVRQGDNGATGALPGRAWLNSEFTAQALRSALAGNSNVMHIASHFKFEPGDAAASFLLLGDGTRLSLQDLGGPDYRFERTSLVTLSACQTGLSEDDSFGQEVDGLAALLMAQGAPSVLASLWQVADDSTATLMASFYRIHERREPGQLPASRAQALQLAQLAMIRGETPANAASEQRGISRPQVVAANQGGSALGRAHPYYWAPFVLMGSWR